MRRRNRRQPTRRKSRALIWISAVNLILLITLYIIESRVAERHWFGTSITYAPQHFFGLPAFVLLIWAAGRKNKWGLAINGFAIVFFSVGLLGFRVPWRVALHSMGGQGSSRPMTISLVTYNIHHSAGGGKLIANEIRKLKPDVVCLQEANCKYRCAGAIYELTKPPAKWHMIDYGELAVLSRYPIKSYEICHMEWQTGRTLLKVVLDVRGRTVTLLNVHLNSPLRPGLADTSPVLYSERLKSSSGLRSVQVSVMRNVIKDVKTPLIIAGDFNTPPVGPMYRQISADLIDSFGSAGWGLGHTFRSDMPVMRIDYVFLGGGAYPTRCRVPVSRLSDHRPVVAEIEIPR